jgi:hypothetical protein
LINTSLRFNLTDISPTFIMPATSPFAKKLASVAQEQHAKFQFTNEADPALCNQIRRWTRDMGFQFTSCTQVPWSAVFVSWGVKQARIGAFRCRD